MRRGERRRGLGRKRTVQDTLGLVLELTLGRCGRNPIYDVVVPLGRLVRLGRRHVGARRKKREVEPFLVDHVDESFRKCLSLPPHGLELIGLRIATGANVAGNGIPGGRQ